MAQSITIPADPSTLLVIGTGGSARERKAYENGVATGAPIMRDGAAVRAVTGLAVSVAGVGLDGATVQTVTPLEEISAGQIYAAEGAVEIIARAEAKPGFGGGSPRADLNIVVFIERLVPKGDVTSLLAGAASGGRRAQGGEG